MEFSRQEYWSGVAFPSPGDLPDPEIEPVSPALAGGFFTREAYLASEAGEKAKKKSFNGEVLSSESLSFVSSSL